MVQSGKERAPLAPRADRSLVVSPPLLLQRRAGLPRRAQRGPQAVIVRVRGSVDLPQRRRRIHHASERQMHGCTLRVRPSNTPVAKALVALAVDVDGRFPLPRKLVQ